MFVTTLPMLLAADQTGGSTTTTSSGVWGNCTVGTDQVARLTCAIPLFNNIINAALAFGGTIAVIMLIYGGLRMMLSSGDAKQAGAARQTITYAILGLVVILLSFTMLQFIQYLTGVRCIDTFGFGNSETGGCQ